MHIIKMSESLLTVCKQGICAIITLLMNASMFNLSKLALRR